MDNTDKMSEALRSLSKFVDQLGPRERRVVPGTPAEIRQDEDVEGTHLVGYAAVFNKETVIGSWFRELIEPGAFRKTIKEGDVRHLFNHDPSVVLARSAPARGVNTLTLSEDKIGLAFDAELNLDDPDAVRVRAKVARGDVDQSSFAFRIIRQAWEDGEVDENAGTRRLPLRRIQEVQLFDTSTVTYPAYEDTESGIRAMGGALLQELDDESKTVVLHNLIEHEGEMSAEARGIVQEIRSAMTPAGEEPPAPIGEPADEESPGVHEAQAYADRQRQRSRFLAGLTGEQ